MGAAVARVALEAARSRGVEAGGVTRDSNAHLTASLSLSTDGRGRRVDRGPEGIKSPAFAGFRALLQRERHHGLGLGLLDGKAGTTRS
jgi:hypothetical protein